MSVHDFSHVLSLRRRQAKWSRINNRKLIATCLLTCRVNSVSHFLVPSSCVDEVTNVSHFLATIEMEFLFLSGLSFTFDALQILTQPYDKEGVNFWERGDEE